MYYLRLINVFKYISQFIGRFVSASREVTFATSSILQGVHLTTRKTIGFMQNCAKETMSFTFHFSIKSRDICGVFKQTCV